jgi:hypothetical protein
MGDQKPFKVEYWNPNIPPINWTCFKECSTEPEADMFLRHYRGAHPQFKWRVEPHSEPVASEETSAGVVERQDG